MCKKVVCLAVLTLAVPLVAFANSIDVSHVRDVVSGSSSGLSRTESTLVSFRQCGGGQISALSASLPAPSRVAMFRLVAALSSTKAQRSRMATPTWASCEFLNQVLWACSELAWSGWRVSGCADEA
jgi:hypothetical protein